MSKPRLILLSILVLALSVIVGMACATQYVAAGLSYHPDLGRPFLRLNDVSLYMPWMFWVWSFRFGASGGGVFDTAYVFQIMGMACGVLGIVMLKRLGGDTHLGVKPFGEQAWGRQKKAPQA